MDLAMPQMNGVAATEQITALDGAVKVIALVRQMLMAGASAYVLKVGVFEELLAAIAPVSAI